MKMKQMLILTCAMALAFPLALTGCGGGAKLKAELETLRAALQETETERDGLRAEMDVVAKTRDKLQKQVGDLSGSRDMLQGQLSELAVARPVAGTGRWAHQIGQCAEKASR